MNLPKNAAALISDSISAKAKEAPESKEPSLDLDSSEEGEMGVEEAAASELMDAFAAKDPSRLAAAFRAMFDAVSLSEPDINDVDFGDLE